MASKNFNRLLEKAHPGRDAAKQAPEEMDQHADKNTSCDRGGIHQPEFPSSRSGEKL
jgi:hypothetical protein